MSAGRPLGNYIGFQSKLFQIVHLWVFNHQCSRNSKYVIVRIKINYICAHYTLIVSSRSQIRGRLIKIWQQTKKKKENQMEATLNGGYVNSAISKSACI